MADEYQDSTMAALMRSEKEKETKKVNDTKISSKISRYQDISKDDPLESIRKIVKDIGHATSPLRITPNESDVLEDTVHNIKKDYKLKTDKNQVVRIALNYLLDDYERNASTSILVEVLERLNA